MINIITILPAHSYAHEARSIVNDARINEDPTTALIRDLRMEIEMLRSQYGSAKGQAAMAEISELKEKLAATQRLMEESQRSWEEKIARTKAMQEESLMAMEAQGVAKDLRKIDNRMPNLVNLNEDPQLSEMLIYILKEGMNTVISYIATQPLGNTLVGHGDDADVQLGGALVLAQHATITCDDGGIIMHPFAEAIAYVNGQQCTPEADIMLQHGDRIIFGNSHYFRLNIPRDVERRMWVCKSN